jgi:hypothetical protein
LQVLVKILRLSENLQNPKKLSTEHAQCNTLVKYTGGFPGSCNWTKPKSDTVHVLSFDVACTRDRFSLQDLGKPQRFGSTNTECLQCLDHLEAVSN